MKAFDVLAAEDGCKVVTRNGLKVRILCTDAAGPKPICALIIHPNGDEEMERFFPNGYCLDKETESENDLMMLTKTRVVLTNLFRNTVTNEIIVEGSFTDYSKAEAAADKKTEENLALELICVHKITLEDYVREDETPGDDCDSDDNSPRGIIVICAEDEDGDEHIVGMKVIP